MNEWVGKRTSLFGRTDITFPSPLDVKWTRKSDEEQKAWATRRATLPLEWLNLDDVDRILMFAPPDAEQFFPVTKEDMDVYTQWTLKKNEIDEIAESGLITESERQDLQDAAEERVTSYLLGNGRESEVAYMNMWPIEKLYVLGMLPPELEYLMPEIRFAKEIAVAEGRKQPREEILDPIYASIQNRAVTDANFGAMLEDLGLTLFDESSYDAIAPKLILGGFESDF
jgi:hypothetical protein